MSIGFDCCQPCPEVQSVSIPGIQGLTGPAGADGANGVIAPGVVNPEGNVIGIPGQTYLNTTDDSFWIKKSGVSTAFGWINLIAGAAMILFMLFGSFSANAQAVMRTYWTTNTTPVVAATITNTALVSQTNNYSWSSNNIVAITTTNSTVTTFYTNVVRWMNTNDSAFTNQSLLRTRWAVTNDAAVTNQLLFQLKSTVTNSFPLATNKSGFSGVVYAVDQFALTNQWWFTNGVLYTTNRYVF